ncbi:MAG: phage major capsid protein [Oscillospiraceae bacterium]|nr:phage major capsid protein [Oscillospiraceae bacterium]
MYDSVKLEKGMYHLANRTFAQALEEADPSAQYAGTPLQSLDAFERQLKRFDIRVSGENCDRVEKFFTTTESAVLFPEFVRRAIKSGMEDSLLPELTAASAAVNATACKGFSVDETDGAYSTVTAEGAVLKKTAITEGDSFALDKFGRIITASYETVRQQRIDVFAVMLRAVGKKLAGAIAAKALTVIKNAADSFNSAGSAIAYADLAALYGRFTDYDLTAVIASPANAAAILAMTEMRDRSLGSDGEIRLPFGAKLLKDASIGDSTVIGISRDFALAAYTGSDVLLESDRLIDCQLDRIAVSVRIGFQPLMSGAAAVLNIVS